MDMAVDSNSDRLRRRLALSTSGYEFIIHLSSLKNSRDRIGIVAQLVPKPTLQLAAIQSRMSTILLTDLNKLGLYLEKHINSNLEDESHIFLGYDCIFQVQALEGFLDVRKDVIDPKNSEFSIRCLVNIGQTEALPQSEYFGGESTVSLDECIDFVNAIKESYCAFKNHSNDKVN